MRFTKAIVRAPCEEMIHGLTTSNLGRPDYNKALIQHSRYIDALRSLNLEVTVLDPNKDYPDSVFVEDTALLTPQCAIITNPGAPSRRGEVHEICKTLEQYFNKIEYVQDPGTVDAGDIMMVGSHYYIGLSERTNDNGANQVKEILDEYGMTASVIPIKNVLHLKSGISYLENNNLVAGTVFVKSTEFKTFNIIEVDKGESYAANCVWINGTVLIAKGSPKIKKTIQSYGYRIIELDVSEFRKLDGGLSCLSLRF